MVKYRSKDATGRSDNVKIVFYIKELNADIRQKEVNP